MAVLGHIHTCTYIHTNAYTPTTHTWLGTKVPENPFLSPIFCEEFEMPIEAAATTRCTPDTLRAKHRYHRHKRKHLRVDFNPPFVYEWWTLYCLVIYTCTIVIQHHLLLVKSTVLNLHSMIYDFRYTALIRIMSSRNRYRFVDLCLHLVGFALFFMHRQKSESYVRFCFGVVSTLMPVKESHSRVSSYWTFRISKTSEYFFS